MGEMDATAASDAGVVAATRDDGTAEADAARAIARRAATRSSVARVARLPRGATSRTTRRTTRPTWERE
jgi:hypothetical protein